MSGLVERHRKRKQREYDRLYKLASEAVRAEARGESVETPYELRSDWRGRVASLTVYAVHDDRQLVKAVGLTVLQVTITAWVFTVLSFPGAFDVLGSDILATVAFVGALMGPMFAYGVVESALGMFHSPTGHFMWLDVMADARSDYWGIYYE